MRASVSLIKINDQCPATWLLYSAVQFASQPFDKPVNNLKSISHAIVGAVHLRLIKLECICDPPLA